MKNTLNTSEVASLLMADDNASWTMAGAYALAEYLEQIEEDCGTEVEFDRVAVRCQFNQYKTALEAALEYVSIDEIVQRRDEIDNLEGSALEYLQENAMVCEFEGGIIVSEF